MIVFSLLFRDCTGEIGIESDSDSWGPYHNYHYSVNIWHLSLYIYIPLYTHRKCGYIKLRWWNYIYGSSTIF